MLFEQFVEIVRPYGFFGFCTAQRDFGGPYVAAVMEHHAITFCGNARRKVFNLLIFPPAAWCQGDPWALGPQNFIVDLNAANGGIGHVLSFLYSFARYS